MKRIIILILVAISLTGCEFNEVTNSLSYTDSIKEIMTSSEHVIIDVRTKEEYDKGHVKGAINIPYDQIDENIDIDKKNIVFVYCGSGRRSNIAFNVLIEMGYTVYDLGGFSSINLPIE